MITGKGFLWLRRIGLTAMTAFVLVPLYAMAVTAFVPAAEARETFSWFPDHLTLAAFGDMWTTIPLARYLINSVLVAVTATVLAVIIAVPAGWCLARRDFLGRRAILAVLLATQTVSGLLFLIPTVLIISEADRRLATTFQGGYIILVVTAVGFALPFSVGLLASFFASVPLDMEETAYDLGAGPVTTLLKVVIPTSWPPIGAITVFAFSMAWGEVMFTSVLSNSDTRTLAVGLSAYSSDAGTLWNQLMAAGILASLPVVAAFVLVRKHLVMGLARAATGPNQR